MEDYRIDLVIGQGPGARIHPFKRHADVDMVRRSRRRDLCAAVQRKEFQLV